MRVQLVAGLLLFGEACVGLSKDTLLHIVYDDDDREDSLKVNLLLPLLSVSL